MSKIARTETQKKNDLIVGIIRKYSVNHRPEQVAKMAGMSRSAYFNCLKNPEDFRLHQIRGICKGLKVPDTEMKEVLL